MEKKSYQVYGKIITERAIKHITEKDEPFELSLRTLTEVELQKHNEYIVKEFSTKFIYFTSNKKYRIKKPIPIKTETFQCEKNEYNDTGWEHIVSVDYPDVNFYSWDEIFEIAKDDLIFDLLRFFEKYNSGIELGKYPRIEKDFLNEFIERV